MHKQLLVRKTDQRGNHPFARVWVLRCKDGHEYGANSCDFHVRRCPTCNSTAKPGLAF